MLDKLIKEVCKGVGEIVVSPITILTETVSSLDKAIKKVTEPNHGDKT